MSAKAVTVRTLATFLRSTLVSATFVLAVSAPRLTLAEGDLAVAEGTRIGDVLVKGTIVRDASFTSGWAVEIAAKNLSDGPQRCALETSLTRSVSNPMARVMPMAQTVWTQRIAMTLGGGQTATKRLEVPTRVATQLAVVAVKHDEQGDAIGRVVTRFALRLQRAAA